MKIFSDYVVIDVETTGLNPGSGDRVIAVSGLKISNNEIQSQFFSFLNPGITIDPFVQKITGIRNGILKNASTGSIVFPKFLAFIGNLPIISHNSEFDKKFLENELRNFNLHGILQYNDILLTARELFVHQNCSIRGLIEKLELTYHSVEGLYESDVKNIFQIYEALKLRLLS
jgi:DNA polymerase III alpha subunit (gram-positive type)